MAEGIIDLLEVIKIQKEKRRIEICSSGPADYFIELPLKKLAVWQTCQRIEKGQLLQRGIAVTYFRNHLVECVNQFAGFVIGLMLNLGGVLPCFLDVAHGHSEGKNGADDAALKRNGNGSPNNARSNCGHSSCEKRPQQFTAHGPHVGNQDKPAHRFAATNDIDGYGQGPLGEHGEGALFFPEDILLKKGRIAHRCQRLPPAVEGGGIENVGNAGNRAQNAFDLLGVADGYRIGNSCGINVGGCAQTVFPVLNTIPDLKPNQQAGDRQHGHEHGNGYQPGDPPSDA